MTPYIDARPEVCGGKPCIAGSRIRVQDVYVWHELHGLSADEIVSRFPQLSMAAVYAALGYYWDHRDEIQRQMNEETALAEKLKRISPSLLKPELPIQNGPDHRVFSIVTGIALVFSPVHGAFAQRIRPAV